MIVFICQSLIVILIVFLGASAINGTFEREIRLILGIDIKRNISNLREYINFEKEYIENGGRILDKDISDLDLYFIRKFCDREYELCNLLRCGERTYIGYRPISKKEFIEELNKLTKNISKRQKVLIEMTYRH